METNVELKKENGARIDAKFTLVKFILLSLVTFGIYGVYTYAKIGNLLNQIACQYDGKKTMNFWLIGLVIGPITLGIGSLVWFHKFSARIGVELGRRNIEYSFGAATFWGWNVLGAIILVGPLIYVNKLMKAMNQLIADYNQRG